MNEKKLIPETPAVRSGVEAVIVEYEKPPLSLRLTKPIEPADHYIGVVVDSAFTFKGAQIELIRFFNSMTSAGYRLFLNRSLGYGVDFLVFEKVEK